MEELLESETTTQTCENTVEENNLEQTSLLALYQNDQEDEEDEDEDEEMLLVPNPNNQPNVIRKFSILTKTRILISCIIILLLVILLLISIIIRSYSLHSEPQSPTTAIYNTITTTATIILTQSSTPTIETITYSSRSCPISAVNSTWNNSGILFINRSNRCVSTENGLCSPRDIFIDDVHDTIYVVDAKNNRIQKYLLNEIYNSEVGAIGITVARKGLILPQSIFVDTRTEDMYIMDLDQEKAEDSPYVVSYRVHLWKKNEKVGRILVSEVGEYLFWQPYHHLTLDKQMNIYVGTRYFIKKWLASTDYTEKIIVAGKSERNNTQSTDLFDPAQFFITEDLTLYIADWNNKRVQRWTVNATEGTTVIGNLLYVMGITMDCNGYLYYAETNNQTIYQLNMMTNQSRMIVRNEDNFGKLIYYWPSTIKIDKFGNLFAIGYDQIYKFSIIEK
ncbi:unnamed protein product [Adineta steineri]|uniref:Uncharacterized protein n=1 Tax=Adineta steineri TaxID=433720 RepID=A0A819K234_9BILA|nr:unnamed protein product [Adineta steineri]CAF3941519.1 unnamed protein product [Adineta steineri]